MANYMVKNRNTDNTGSADFHKNFNRQRINFLDGAKVSGFERGGVT